MKGSCGDGKKDKEVGTESFTYQELKKELRTEKIGEDGCKGSALGQKTYDDEATLTKIRNNHNDCDTIKSCD